MCTQKSLIVLLTVILAAGLIAGDKSYFSGTWILNEKKSELDDMGTQFLPYEIKITQKGNEITIEKAYEGEFEDMVIDEALTLDGKACKSEFWNSPRVTTATYSGNGKLLVIVSHIQLNMNGNESEMDLTEILSLNPDSKMLKIKHRSSSDWGERSVIMTFNKKVSAPKETE